MLEIEIHKSFKSRSRDTRVYCKAAIKKGITTAIYGKSGVGKSTVLRMIAGLENPNKGQITYMDEVWFDDSKKINRPIGQRNIGFVFQDFNLFPNMTVEGNLKYASGKKIDEAIYKLLEATGLEKLLKSYPAALSGGEKQRVSIIRALCQNPDLLLLDEPFSALDDESIGQLIEEIRIIQEQTGTTVLVISHRKDVIIEMAQEVVHMKGPDSVVQGIPSEILTRRF